MPQLKLFVVAETVIADRFTGQLTLVNVLEHRVHGVVPQLAGVAIWDREEGDEGVDFQVVLRVTSPDNEVTTHPMNFQITTERHRTVHRLFGIRANGVGELKFELILNGDTRGQYTVALKERPEPKRRPPR